MTRWIAAPALVLVLAAPVRGAGPRADVMPIAYIQATVAALDPAAGSLAFVSASGQSRVLRARGRALASLPNLRQGDEVILTVEGPAGRPVVTAVKVARPVPPPPALETFSSPYAQAAMTSSRPSWPNPYSRINPGLPLRPARAPRVRGGTLNVMPAGMRTAGPAPSLPIAAPAVLTPVSAAPATPIRADASSVDALRARGARDFEAAVAGLAAEARQVDATYARYKASCPTASAVSQDGSREWFGLWDGAAVSETSVGCAALLEEMSRRAAPIKAGMLAAQEAARRAWVLPGTEREIRRRHAMEWNGWDR